jgi:hypothetical protein
MFKNQDLPKIRMVLSLLIIAFIFTGCCTIFCPDCKPKTDYAVLLDSNRRLGPLDLPLEEPQKIEILVFLMKGGMQDRDSYVDPGAKIRYSGLLDLLSRNDFLSDKNFLVKGKKKKVSQKLREWFNDTVVYWVVDATKDPPCLNEITMTDGIFWWIFYRSENEDADGYYAITKMLISLKPIKALEHFSQKVIKGGK